MVRYRWYNLGHQEADSAVVIHLRGSAVNVILLDPLNFARYRSGQGFRYTGGHYRRSPVQLQIPRDGRWFVVIDHGGYKGNARAEIEVLTSDELDALRETQTTFAGAAVR